MQKSELPVHVHARRDSTSLQLQGVTIVMPPSEFGILRAYSRAAYGGLASGPQGGGGNTSAPPIASTSPNGSSVHTSDASASPPPYHARLSTLQWLQAARFSGDGRCFVSTMVEDGFLGFNITLTTQSVAFEQLPLEVRLGDGDTVGNPTARSGGSDGDGQSAVTVKVVLPVVLVSAAVVAGVLSVLWVRGGWPCRRPDAVLHPLRETPSCASGSYKGGAVGTTGGSGSLSGKPSSLGDGDQPQGVNGGSPGLNQPDEEQGGVACCGAIPVTNGHQHYQQQRTRSGIPASATGSPLAAHALPPQSPFVQQAAHPLHHSASNRSVASAGHSIYVVPTIAATSSGGPGFGPAIAEDRVFRPLPDLGPLADGAAARQHQQHYHLTTASSSQGQYPRLVTNGPHSPMGMLDQDSATLLMMCGAGGCAMTTPAMAGGGVDGAGGLFVPGNSFVGPMTDPTLMSRLASGRYNVSDPALYPNSHSSVCASHATPKAAAGSSAHTQCSAGGAVARQATGLLSGSGSQAHVQNLQQQQLQASHQTSMLAGVGQGGQGAAVFGGILWPPASCGGGGGGGGGVRLPDALAGGAGGGAVTPPDSFEFVPSDQDQLLIHRMNMSRDLQVRACGW